MSASMVTYRFPLADGAVASIEVPGGRLSRADAERLCRAVAAIAMPEARDSRDSSRDGCPAVSAPSGRASATQGL